MTVLAAANLPTFSADQLGTAYTIANRRAVSATTVLARTRALALRDRITGEASARGMVVRKLWDGSYAVHYPASFEPIR